MIELLSGRKHPKLIAAWLDELGLLHRLQDDATADERAKFIDRAEAAAISVVSSYDDLKGAGKLKELGARYKLLRQTAKVSGKKIKPWSAYVMAEKIKAIRAMARTQRARARRGIKV